MYYIIVLKISQMTKYLQLKRIYITKNPFGFFKIIIYRKYFIYRML